MFNRFDVSVVKDDGHGGWIGVTVAQKSERLTQTKDGEGVAPTDICPISTALPAS